MAFLEQLQSHKGGLIKLKTELYWFNGRGWDGNPGQVCLLLDAATAATRTAASAAATVAAAANALLLIDGSPHWVWMSAENVELL